MDSSEPAADPQRTRRRRTIGVRARVLATVLILTALGMFGAGLSTLRDQ